MSTQFPGDDQLAARLRDALSSEADMVQPSDNGLQRIREQVDGARRPWYLHPAVLAVAAAVVLGAIAGVGFAFLGGSGSPDVVAGQPKHTASATPSDTATPSPSTSESPTQVPFEGDVFVYYVMDDGQAPRLYREEHPGTGASPAVAGLTEALSAAATDPDYASPWPAGTRLLSYTVDASTDGGVATVDVSKFVQVGAEAENVAVQQLVYTVTANDKSVSKVRLLVNGSAPRSGHQDWSQPIARAPMLDVQGLIWLLAPAEGATVSSPVQIDGYGTAFEATISWEVRKGGANGAKVAEGTTMGGSNGEFGEFHDTVDLPPGTYELRAFESSAEDGRPLHVDTKTFTVR